MVDACDVEDLLYKHQNIERHDRDAMLGAIFDMLRMQLRIEAQRLAAEALAAHHAREEALSGSQVPISRVVGSL